MVNRVKEKLAKGQPILGTFFHLGSAAAMECLGIAGLDFAIIDTEHGPFEAEGAINLIRAAELKGMTPFVRTKDTSRAAILKMLDSGAGGLVIPCVESADEVRQVVAWGKYAPQGQRGFFLGRPAEYGFATHAQPMDGYFDHCNQNALLLPQCETKGCLNSIEEIAAIDGVDGIFIGPYDLSIALGRPAQFQHPDFAGALNRVQDACKAAGKPCFIYTGDAATAKSHFAQGFSGVAVNFDAAVLIEGYRAMRHTILGEE